MIRARYLIVAFTREFFAHCGIGAWRERRRWEVTANACASAVGEAVMMVLSGWLLYEYRTYEYGVTGAYETQHTNINIL